MRRPMARPQICACRVAAIDQWLETDVYTLGINAAYHDCSACLVHDVLAIGPFVVEKP